MVDASGHGGKGAGLHYTPFWPPSNGTSRTYARKNLRKSRESTRTAKVGIAYRQKGDCGRAIRDYDRAISLNARFAPTYYNRALAHYFIRDYTKAWADVRACQRLGGKVHPRFLADLRKASGRHR